MLIEPLMVIECHDTVTLYTPLTVEPRNTTNVYLYSTQTRACHTSHHYPKDRHRIIMVINRTFQIQLCQRLIVNCTNRD